MCIFTSTMKKENLPELDFALDVEFGDILTNPILDIAARFWEKERYEAFRVCYRSMRIIDDLVDNRKAAGRALPEGERKQYVRLITDWLETTRRKTPTDAFQKELISVIETFRLPLWPWEKLTEAMTYDLAHDGYATFRTFLRYCEGAAVAPASVFMHLCGVRKENGGYRKPPFDIRKAARPLALFSYLVHIIRDFEKDQASNLNYFADDLLARHGLNKSTLKDVAGNAAGEALRKLMAQYRGFADHYRRRARAAIDAVFPMLDARYRLSLEIVYRLYLQIFERIDIERGNFTAEELQPTSEEIRHEIQQTVRLFQEREA